MLELNDVSKTYEEGKVRVLAVDGVTLKVVKGELLLIIGPSGSGKTTLLSIMGCILSPTKGDVIVDGMAIGAFHEDALPDIRKRYFGFVFQSFNLFPSLTAIENIELILRLKGKKGKILRKEALGLLETVSLSDRADFYPRDLSGGQKQRVAFARALAGDAPIILADEPTANLDSRTGREVLELLRGLAESGRAVVVVSHDPRAETLAHRVVSMEDGRIK